MKIVKSFAFFACRRGALRCANEYNVHGARRITPITFCKPREQHFHVDETSRISSEANCARKRFCGQKIHHMHHLLTIFWSSENCIINGTWGFVTCWITDILKKTLEFVFGGFYGLESVSNMKSIAL